MLERLLLVGAAACILAAAPITAAQAQVSQTPATYKGPDGSYAPAGVAQLLGADAITGAPCLVGVTATCQLPSAAASTPSPANGTSSYSASGGTGAALLTASPQQIGASGPHSLYHWQCANGVAQTVYLQIFDLASGGVTLGATVPKLTYPIPASGYWEEHYPGEERPAFANAITVALTTTPTGPAAPATGAVCNFLFK